MKSPKKPSKEPSLPFQDETRRANVQREEMLSQFRTLGEAFSLLRDDVHSMKPQIAKIDKLDADVEILKSAVRTNGQDISALKEAVRENAEATRALKNAVHGNTNEIRSLKETVQGKTEAIKDIQADLKQYNQRLEVVEAKLTS